MPLIIPSNSQSATGYTIDQSIRFNKNDSAYMLRTPSGAGSGTAWTISFWFKLAEIPPTDIRSFLAVDGATNSSNRFRIGINDSSASGFGTDGQLFVTAHSTKLIYTNRLFRDPSAWYHVVYTWDSANAVASERQRLYINGVRETSFATSTNPTASQVVGWNTANRTSIGASYGISSGTVIFYADDYMAEIHNLDGYSYDASFFGEFNDSGIWIPKEYSGSYGTNGFHIKGESASDLGNDSSGNNNDFTTSGLGTHDQVLDSPTNNFCTYNSIQLQSGATLSAGNLDAVSSGSSWRNVHSTIGVSSGKWYWEVKADVINSSQTWIAGIQETSFESKSNYWWQSGYTASSSGIVFGVLDSNYKVTNVTRTSFTHDIAQGDIVQFQLNLDDNELTVLVDGVSKGKIYDITADTEYTPAVCLYSTSSATINFGQEGTFSGTETAGGNSDGNGVGNFKYSVPSGYLALCTKNLGS